MTPLIHIALFILFCLLRRTFFPHSFGRNLSSIRLAEVHKRHRRGSFHSITGALLCSTALFFSLPYPFPHLAPSPVLRCAQEDTDRARHTRRRRRRLRRRRTSGAVDRSERLRAKSSTARLMAMTKHYCRETDDGPATIRAHPQITWTIFETSSYNGCPSQRAVHHGPAEMDGKK